MEMEPRQGTAPEPLTLGELNALKIGASVWIEERKHEWNKDATGLLRFFRLFPARLIWIGIPVGGTLRSYHFNYVYTDGRTYGHNRTEAFYGREWRCWTSRPTDEQREATPWTT